MTTSTHPARLSALALCVSWAYPVMVFASLHLTWLIAWSILGHAPRPSLDDPKDISHWLAVPYHITLLLMIGIPVAAVGGIGVIAWFGSLRKFTLPAILLSSVALIVVWIAAVMFLRWDPLYVVYWFMD